MKKLLIFFLFFLSFGSSIYSQTWTQLNVGTNYMVYRLSFPSNDSGYILIDNGVIKRTFDGGNSWTLVATPPHYGVYGIYFMNAMVGFIHGDSASMGNNVSVIFKTIDGGNSWQKILSLPMRSIANLSCIDQNIIYVSAVKSNPNDSSYVYQTIDGGNSWVVNRVDHRSIGILPLSFQSLGIGYYSVDHSIYSTFDTSNTWQTSYIDVSGTNVIDHFIFPGLDTGYAFGMDVILQTTDSGHSWVQKNMPAIPSTSMYSTHFFNGQCGFACGGDGWSAGWIQRTVDGCINWTSEYVSPYTFNCMEFPSDSIGYVGGTMGTLLKYASNPSSVSELSSPLNFTLFPNPAKESIMLKDVPLHSQIKLIDANGKLLLNEKAESAEVTLDTHTYAAGIYFVEVSDGKNVTRKKVVLQ